MAEGMEDFLGRNPGRPPVIPFECRIVTSGVNSSTDQVDAREINGNRMIHRDCRWAPRVISIRSTVDVMYPEVGDRALVLISDDGEPWIVEWTPYAS